MQNIEQILTKHPHNKLYLFRYIKFIKSCHIFNFGKMIKTEKHHILPKGKYLFPEYAQLDIFQWNCVNLTPRQHYIAHWILSKVFLENLQIISSLKAFSYMAMESSSCKRNVTSRQFERAREANRESMILKNPMRCPETVLKMKNSFRSYFTPEVRKMISDRRTGINNITEEGRQKLSALAKETGLGKTRSPNQQQNIRISMSKGKWITPFGEFYNPTEASTSSLNVSNISRHRIQRQCLEKINGFDFIPKI